MPTIHDSTLPVSERPVKCVECGYYCDPQIPLCPQCGEALPHLQLATTTFLTRDPLTMPVISQGQDFLDPEVSLILQPLPSGICIPVALQASVFLGRNFQMDDGESVDLSEFNAQKHGVSREHCLLQREGTQLIVTDLGSTNGTYLNGRKISPNEPYVVANGDELILGSLRLIVSFSRIVRG